MQIEKTEQGCLLTFANEQFALTYDEMEEIAKLVDERTIKEWVNVFIADNDVEETYDLTKDETKTIADNMVEKITDEYYGVSTDDTWIVLDEQLEWLGNERERIEN